MATIVISFVYNILADLTICVIKATNYNSRLRNENKIKEKKTIPVINYSEKKKYREKV